jgi:hypothetical protein
VSGAYGAQEVLAQGRENAPRSGRPGRARPNRRQVVPIALVALLAGVGIARYAVTGPKLPRLTIAEATQRGAARPPPVVPWLPGEDERPAGNVFLTMDAALSVAGGSAGTVDVLGVTGPGIVDAASPPLRVMRDRQPTTGVLAADVDCTQVRLPLGRDAYGVSVRVVDGSRRVEGVLPAGSLGRRWGALVASACGSWLARHDLTVTQVSATVDSLQASVDLTFTIANTGINTAYVAATAAGGALAVSAHPQGVIEVRPSRGAHFALSVDVRECDAIPPLPPSGGGGVYGTTADVLGLVAMVGTRPDVSLAESPTDGFGPTGVVFGRGAASALAGALRSACGGLGPYVTLITARGFDFDRRTGVLTVRIRLDGTPGRVTDLRLVSDSAPAGDPAVFTPLWTTSGTLVPDRAGQVTTTLRYRAPPSGSTCPALGSWIPAFTVLAQVPVPFGVKTLRYSQLIDPAESPEAVRQLCPALV